MKQRTIQFTVEGRGAFPVDMLRYDSCWPAGPDDADRIGYAPDADRRTVTLKRVTDASKHAMHLVVTADRWRSFGWAVVVLPSDCY